MKKDITAIVLAGGQGSRLNHQDKGLVEWHDRPFISHICSTLRHDTQHLIISCNRNHKDYSSYADEVVSDYREDYQGPLSGIESSLRLVKTPFALLYPCDCPIVPADYVVKLYAVASQTGFAYAYDGERIQPLMSLFRTEYLESVETYLEKGKRSVIGWIKENDYEKAANQVDFSAQSEDFINVNTPPDLETLRKINPS